SNSNHAGAGGDPFSAPDFRDRYFQFCGAGTAMALAGPAPVADRHPAASEALALTARPNPARGRMQFAWNVRHAERVELALYDVGGRRVKTVIEGDLAPGRFVRGWDLADETGTKVRSGVYLARLRTGPTETVTRLVVLQ